MGMSHVKLVARGVDTLLLNVYYMDEQERPVKRDLSYALVERLDAWKQGAIEAEGPIVVPWVDSGAGSSRLISSTCASRVVVSTVWPWYAVPQSTYGHARTWKWLSCMSMPFS